MIRMLILTINGPLRANSIKRFIEVPVRSCSFFYPETSILIFTSLVAVDLVSVALSLLSPVCHFCALK